MERNTDCEHPDFVANVAVNRIENIRRFSADVRIKCSKCGVPFRFIGLPAGLVLDGAAVSVDATEARLAIAPKGEVLSELEGGVVGFSVRKQDVTRAASKEGRIAAVVLQQFETTALELAKYLLRQRGRDKLSDDPEHCRCGASELDVLGHEEGCEIRSFMDAARAMGIEGAA